MSKYYRGNIERMTVERIKIYKGIKTLVTGSTVIRKDAIFYKNRFGVLINAENGEAPIRKEEAYDYLTHITENAGNGIGEACQFVDTAKLTPAEDVTKEDVKQLRKAYKEKHIN